jgi:hypothetical protein
MKEVAQNGTLKNRMQWFLNKKKITLGFRATTPQVKIVLSHKSKISSPLLLPHVAICLRHTNSHEYFPPNKMLMAYQLMLHCPPLSNSFSAALSSFLNIPFTL